MGLSMVGGIAGTFAWYQYSTQATTSFIGTSVGQTGVLEVSATSATAGFKRDLIAADLLAGRANNKVTPMTFGALVADGSLPANAYKNPNASKNKGSNPGSYGQAYQAATAAEDYIQYSVYVRARDAQNNLLAKDVFLTDIVLEDADHKIDKALRVHVAIDEDGDDAADKYLLFGRDAVEGLRLFGYLDCDDDGSADIKGGYQWVAGRESLVTYGNAGDFQDAIAMDDLVATVEGDGSIDPLNADNIGKKLFTTITTENKAVKVTVTVWLEGWDNRIANFQKDGVKVGALTENIYEEDASVIGEDLTGKGLYTKAAGVYTVAAGIAEPAQHYYAVDYRLVHLAKDEVIPADTYRATALATADFIDAGTVEAVNGIDVYEVIDREVSVKASKADTSDRFVKDAGNYVASSGVADNAKTYYRQVAGPVATEAVPSTTPAGTVSVEGKYKLDVDTEFNEVYVLAHGLNEAGVAYYTLAEATVDDVPMWAAATVGVDFKFGLTFDVGENAFKD